MEEGEAPSAGGGEDFGELYRANLRPLLGMATALIGSRAQAEEVVQEAFATTFDHYGRLAAIEVTGAAGLRKFLSLE